MIWLILSLGLILRLICLNQSLWLDEAINVTAVKDNGLIDLITNYARFDFHPPGYFVILWGWTKLFGFSEIVVRMPSVIFGLVTVYLTFLIGKKIHSAKLGLFAATLMAENPLHLYYSQEARMYSFAAMAVCLSYLFLIKLIRQERYTQIGYCLSLLLVLSADYLAYFIIPAQLIFLLLLEENKRFFLSWLKLLSISVLTFVWWIPFFINQLNSGISGANQVPGWRDVVGSFGLKPLGLTFVKFLIGRISYPNNLIYTALFLPIGTFFAYLGVRGFLKSEKNNKVMLISWLVIPAALVWFISSIIPVYSYFRLLFLLPAFILLISSGIIFLCSKLQRMVLVAVIIIEFACSSIYLANPVFQREDWRSMVMFFQDQPSSSPVLLESNESFLPFDYYATNKLTTIKQVNTIGALKKFPAFEENELKDLRPILLDNNKVYLVNYLVEISDPNRFVQKKLNQLGYRQIKIHNFNGVGFVFEYQR